MGSIQKTMPKKCIQPTWMFSHSEFFFYIKSGQCDLANSCQIGNRVLQTDVLCNVYILHYISVCIIINPLGLLFNRCLCPKTTFLSHQNKEPLYHLSWSLLCDFGWLPRWDFTWALPFFKPGHSFYEYCWYKAHLNKYFNWTKTYTLIWSVLRVFWNVFLSSCCYSNNTHDWTLRHRCFYSTITWNAFFNCDNVGNLMKLCCINSVNLVDVTI